MARTHVVVRKGIGAAPSTVVPLSSLAATVQLGTIARIASARRLPAGVSSTAIANAPTVPAQPGILPIGALAHDGPATPEQISLLLPVTGVLPQGATATCRYRTPVGSGTWLTGHPLYRIRQEYVAFYDVPDAFAWPILGLTPGVTYEVEVTVTSGATSTTRTQNFTTRSLPLPAGAPNKTVALGSSIQNAFNGLDPGDVLEIADGTHNVSDLYLNRSGTTGSPIYIRGQSRDGTILYDPTTTVKIFLFGVSNVIFENFTIQGSGVDAGVVPAAPVGFHDHGSFGSTSRITIRNMKILGVDRAVGFYYGTSGTLIYDNTFIGNNAWTQEFVETNLGWNDDGVLISGIGNAVFNNTITGYGDACAYASHSGDAQVTTGTATHFYRNEIRIAVDDLAEFDYADRNCSFYDNRSHNSANYGSCDPLFGGPFVYARNVCINQGRIGAHKWQGQYDGVSGMFMYNNTFIGTVTPIGTDIAGWYQTGAGVTPSRSYGFRNNLWVYRGAGINIYFENVGSHDPIDWTHNSWYPNTGFQWPGSPFYSTLAAAQAGLPNTTPIFSGTNRRMQNDNTTISNPWTSTITLGANCYTEVTESYVPILANGTTPKNSGVVIPNITDNFSGAAPDRGAVISGRPLPVWGDRTVTTPSAAPAWFTAMADKTWIEIAAGSARTDLPVAQRGNRIVDVKQLPDPPGNTGVSSVCSTWTGGVFNETTGELILPAQGGHSDYFGSEIYALALRTATPSWQRIKDSAPNAQLDTSDLGYNPPYSGNADGSPRATHGWFSDWASSDGRIWRTAGYGNYPGWWGTECYSIDRNNLAAGWTFHGRIHTSVPGGAPGSTFGWQAGTGGYDPISNKIWRTAEISVAGDDVSVIDCTAAVAAGEQPHSGTNPVPGRVNYSTNRNQIVTTRFGNSWGLLLSHTSPRVYIVGDTFDGMLLVMNAESPGTWTFPPSSGANWSATTVHAHWHAASGAIILGGGSQAYGYQSGANLIKIVPPANPLTGTYTWSVVTPSPSNTVIPTVPFWGSFSKFQMCQDMGNGQSAFVMVSDVSGSTFVYKVPATGL